MLHWEPPSVALHIHGFPGAGALFVPGVLRFRIGELLFREAKQRRERLAPALPKDKCNRVAETAIYWPELRAALVLGLTMRI